MSFVCFDHYLQKFMLMFDALLCCGQVLEAVIMKNHITGRDSSSPKGQTQWIRALAMHMQLAIHVQIKSLTGLGDK